MSRRTTIKRRALFAGGLALAAPSIGLTQSKRPVVIWSHFAGANYEIFKRFVATLSEAVRHRSRWRDQRLRSAYIAPRRRRRAPDIFHAPGWCR